MARKTHPTQVQNISIALFAMLVLGGCLSEEGEDTSFNGASTEPPANSAPQISGSPPTNVDVGETYSFTAERIGRRRR